MTDRKEQLIDILTQTGRMEEADEYAEIARQEEREKMLELMEGMKFERHADEQMRRQSFGYHKAIAELRQQIKEMK